MSVTTTVALVAQIGVLSTVLTPKLVLLTVAMKELVVQMNTKKPMEFWRYREESDLTMLLNMMMGERMLVLGPIS